jgi:hypothetical protein
MMKIWSGRVGALVGFMCLMAVVGCNDHPVYQEKDLCPNGGELVSKDGRDFCAFVITETGFLCPSELPHGYEAVGQGDRIGVCSDDPMEDPNEVQRVARQAVEDGAIGDKQVESQIEPPEDDVDRDAGSPDTADDRDAGSPDAAVDVGFSPSGSLDILWIVDNSGSMCEEQASIREATNAFVTPLLEAGIDFQIGIITTDMMDPAESGRLQTMADGAGGPSCEAVDVTECPNQIPRLLTSTAYADSPADLERDLGCLVTRGTGGNGFEMGLEAALTATSPGLLTRFNEGLIREDADLALVFLTDENDCSDRGALDKVNGNICEWESGLLIPVAEYMEHFRVLKEGRNVMVATITAPDTGERFEAPDQVLPSCVSDAGEGYAGYRYDQFRVGFERNWTHNICEGPYDVAGLGRFLSGE